jgi:hypothetical protein
MCLGKKEAKQMAKKLSPLSKICDGPTFHLGTTGNDDDELTDQSYI